MHTHVLGPVAAGLSVLATLVAPAVAGAHSIPRSTNSSADQAAMGAYRTYLGVLTAGAPGAAARASQIVVGVSSTCADGLADLTKLSAAQIEQSALTAYGNEVDADLGLAYISGNVAALNRFGGALDALSWSTPAPTDTTAQFIGAERALAALPPSDLCKDAAALDAAPLSEPVSTQRFLARYHAATRALNAARTAFQSLLAKFETASESKLVAQINALASQYASQAEVSEQTDADSALSALGVTG